MVPLKINSVLLVTTHKWFGLVLTRSVADIHSAEHPAGRLSTTIFATTVPCKSFDAFDL